MSGTAVTRPDRRVYMFLSLVATICGVTCSDPGRVLVPSRGAGSQIALRDTVGGCATFEFRLLPNHAGITADSVPATSCKGSLRVVLDDATKPAINRDGHTLSFGVRLINTGLRPVTAPAHLYAWDDSVTAVASVTRARPVSIAEADSTLRDGARSWSFDTLLAGSAPHVLSPGASARAHMIRLTMRTGATAFRITLRARAQAGAVVGMQPPDSVPHWVYADSNFRAGRFARGVVVVIFWPTATQAQRQQAIDLVGGVVIGGRRLSSGDGYYYLFIPDDGSGKQLDTAVARLRALPQVQGAATERPSYPAYLRPHDGTGWQTWQLDRHAYGTEQNWDEEADASPLAWGCNTGDTSAHVGVVDFEFDSTELTANVTFGQSLLGAHRADTAEHHGTAVANIVAAHGNDSSGMTGTMWRASLSLGEPIGAATLTSIGVAVESLAVHGATVINLSWQNDYRDSVTAKSDFFSLFAPALRALRSGGHALPLLVIAAGNGDTISHGNQGMPVVYSAFPVARDSYPAIVVGASTSARAAATFSRYGRRVDLYAPGAGVYTWVVHNGTTRIDSVSGTSFSAPQVTGVAGLLKSFDGGLSVDSIRRLVDTVPTGQADSVTDRASRHVPILNAYASLQRAGRRTGAPLCGNRMWEDTTGRKIIVERADTAHKETLGTVPDSSTFGLNPQAIIPLHGGKKIFIESWTTMNHPLEYSLTWAPTTRTWTVAIDSAAFGQLQPKDKAAANLGWDNADHDGDTTLSTAIQDSLVGVARSDGKELNFVVPSNAIGATATYSWLGGTVYVVVSTKTANLYYSIPHAFTTATLIGTVTVSHREAFFFGMPEDGTQFIVSSSFIDTLGNQSKFQLEYRNPTSLSLLRPIVAESPSSAGQGLVGAADFAVSRSRRRPAWQH